MRIAVVIYNLGGPCCTINIQPFLFNLFNDPAIINLPKVFRFLLAKFISSIRASKASKIYQHMGGKSPILSNTYEQAQALENILDKSTYKVFTYMRYSYPFANDTLDEVELYKPDRIILLPLYPQFSTTTTQSSINAWKKEAIFRNFLIPTCYINSYYDHPMYIEAYSELILEKYKMAEEIQKPIILFSAHGIPKKRVDEGDPYQKHIEATMASLVAKLAIKNLEYYICYQSKVGPMEWLGPATDTMIKEFSQKRNTLVVVPIAFVSEHSETLVELDIDYQELALQNGAKGYFRVPTVNCHEKFIECLKDLVIKSVNYV